MGFKERPSRWRPKGSDRRDDRRDEDEAPRVVLTESQGAQGAIDAAAAGDGVLADGGDGTVSVPADSVAAGEEEIDLLLGSAGAVPDGAPAPGGPVRPDAGRLDASDRLNIRHPRRETAKGGNGPEDC